jgi:hypothetical protein
MQSTSLVSECGLSPAPRPGMASHIEREESAFGEASSARVAVGLHLSQRADVSGDCTLASRREHAGSEKRATRGLAYSDPDSSTQHLAGPLRRSSCPFCACYRCGCDWERVSIQDRRRCLPLEIREDTTQQEDIRSVGSWIAEPGPGRLTGNWLGRLLLRAELTALPRSNGDRCRIRGSSPDGEGHVWA